MVANAVYTPTPKLNKALIAAKKEMGGVTFDKVNPFYSNRYATLKGVIDAVMPTLLEHNIDVSQDLVTIDGLTGCYTLVTHESGEERRYGPYLTAPQKNDPQGYASATTYARRYGLLAALGVVAGDEDDDGNAASASAFTSVQARSKVRNALIKASTDGNDAEVQKIRGGMDSDQKFEMMGLLSKPQQKLIQESLHRLETPTDDEVKSGE